MQGLREQQVFGITNAFSRIGGAMRWLLPYFENPDISYLFMLKKSTVSLPDHAQCLTSYPRNCHLVQTFCSFCCHLF